jgi:hypothetical protein
MMLCNDHIPVLLFLKKIDTMELCNDDMLLYYCFVKWWGNVIDGSII